MDRPTDRRVLRQNIGHIEELKIGVDGKPIGYGIGMAAEGYNFGLNRLRSSSKSLGRAHRQNIH